MGTLTWTVWLLLAFTVLATNVEAEAASHHEESGAGGKPHSDHHHGHGDRGGDNGENDGDNLGHGHGHGDRGKGGGVDYDQDHDDGDKKNHDNGYIDEGGNGNDDDDDDDDDEGGDRQGRGYDNKLSKKEKAILKKILKYLALQNLRAKGDFMFNGRRIPIDFILTAVSMEFRSMTSISFEYLWKRIQLYEVYEKKLGSEPPNRNISKYEQVTLLYVKTYMQKTLNIVGSITMDGALVPVLHVSNEIQKRGKNIHNVTIAEIFDVIRDYTKKYETPLIKSPMREQPTEDEKKGVDVIMEFLKTQGTKATGSFMFSEYRISIRFILWYLAQHGTSVKDLTSEQLWRIIRAYIPEFEEINRLPEKEKIVLQNTLKYLKFLGDGATGEVTFNGHKLSIDFIMTVVLLQGADIYSLTVADLWELIKMYEVYEKKLGSEPQNRNINKYEQVTLLYAIEYLRNDDGLTGQIVIEGVKIPVSYIQNHLKIHEQDIRTATIKQIYRIINYYIITYTPPELVPLDKQPTEEQIFELNAIIDFLKTQGTNATGSFIFSGYRISVQFILRYLAQRRLRIEDLKYKELWSIMLLHASNAINTSTKVSGTGPANQDGSDKLYSILKKLLTEGTNATVHIEFKEENISLQFVLSDLSLKYIDARKATAAEI